MSGYEHVDSKHKGAVFLNTSDRGLVGARPCVGHQNDLAHDGRAIFFPAARGDNSSPVADGRSNGVPRTLAGHGRRPPNSLALAQSLDRRDFVTPSSGTRELEQGVPVGLT